MTKTGDKMHPKSKTGYLWPDQWQKTRPLRKYPLKADLPFKINSGTLHFPFCNIYCEASARWVSISNLRSLVVFLPPGPFSLSWRITAYGSSLDPLTVQRVFLSNSKYICQNGKNNCPMQWCSTWATTQSQLEDHTARVFAGPNICPTNPFHQFQ